jgi:hypothetical protein
MQPQPFKRDCTCPPPTRKPGEHTQECDDKYRNEFIALKQQMRDEFYGTARDKLI